MFRKPNGSSSSSSTSAAAAVGEQGQQSTIDSLTINQIAEILRKKHFLREHGVVDSTTGLIVYPDKPINYAKFARKVHGFQNTCRAAALIPILLQLYSQYSYVFEKKNPALFAEINRLNTLRASNPAEFEKQLKIMQVVAMMRSAGRCHGMKSKKDGKVVKNPDHSNGIDFREQSKAECEAVLRELGVDPANVQPYLQAIIDCEDPAKGPADRKADSKEPLNLLGCMLGDAVMLENLRTRTSHDPSRGIAVEAFPVYQNAADDAVDLQQAFNALACEHIKLIKQQQGFVMHGLYVGERNDAGELVKNKYGFIVPHQDGSGQYQLIAGFPPLDDKSAKKPAAEKAQKQLEQNCTYAQIEAAVKFAQAGMQIHATVASIEPQYLVDLRHFIDGKGPVACADDKVVKCSKDKKQAMVVLYRRLRGLAGTDETVGNIVGDWLQNEGKDVDKHTGMFTKKDTISPTKSIDFLDKYLRDYGKEGLSYVQGVAPAAPSMTTSSSTDS